jgi:hypothetical protein
MMYVERAITSDMAALSRGTTGDKTTRSASEKVRDWSVNTDTAGFVHKAMLLPLDISPAAIEEARALVASGQLDSASAIRRAASAIADLGI